jgi:hypothetical protein
MQDWDEQADIPPLPPNPDLPLYHPGNPQFQQHAQAVVPVKYLPPANPQPPPPPPRQMAAQITPPSRGADQKWPKLPIFDGSYKAYPSWKNQFELYINGHPHHFANNAQKITWMLSYILGSPSAIAWADEKRRNVQVLGIQNGTPPNYGDWDTFVVMLNEHFLDPVARQEASRQLFTARQGQLLLNKFFNYFDLWVSLSSINDDQVLLDLMKDAVNPQIVQALGIRGWPASYADFKLVA